MAMRKIWQRDHKGVNFAWIGESAPVPDGWFADINEAQAPVRAHNEDGTFKADDPETPENEAWKKPKKRGRPRKEG